MSVEEAPAPPFLVVYRLSEGYVLDHGGYTVALTNAEDLAARVRDVAGQGEGGFSEPPRHQLAPDLPPELEIYMESESAPTLREATAVPAAVPTPVPQGVVPTGQLDQEWANVRQMMAFMGAGFDSNGNVFTRKDWDAALPMFAPHVDPKEAEYELSEFLGDLHPDD